MTRAVLAPRGRLEIAIHDRQGRLKQRLRRPNRVLAGGRRQVAESLAGLVFNQGFSIAVGADPAQPDDDAVEELLKPITEIKVEEQEVDGERFVVMAAWVADQDQTLGESGVIIQYEQKATRKHHHRLYNRAVIDPVAEVAEGDTVTLTWTLSFHAQAE